MEIRHHVIAFLVAIVASIFAVTDAAAATVFGPKQFMRTSGAPQTFTETIAGCGGTQCRLIVINGAIDGTRRVSSAQLYFQGKLVVGSNAFNQNVDRIIVPVSLDATDELKIVLRSAPGSYVTVSIECDGLAALDIQDFPGVASSIWDDGTVSLSIPLVNEGGAPAPNVTITGMSADGGSYVGPAVFPYSIGTLQPDITRALYALFKNLDGTVPFSLTVNGTYGASGACTFTAQVAVNPPIASNGGQPKSATRVPRVTVGTAVFPPSPPPKDAEPNAEFTYRPPLGPPSYLFATPPAQSVLDRSVVASAADLAPDATPSVSFVRNTTAGSYGLIPPDPTAAGAAVNGFVMIAANTAVSYSKDFGNAFTVVKLTQGSGFFDPSDPSRTDFFPQDDGGLCGDQVLHYVPGRNLMIWLMQYWSPNITVGGLPQQGQNRLRIAYATPEAAAADFLHAWSWFDISPATLGDNTVTDWMDFPDLAYSNGWLYISVSHGLWIPDLDPNGNPVGQRVYSDRRWFVRASLDDMANLAPWINLVYYEPYLLGVVAAHFAQSAPDAMYYAVQSDTSTLRVFKDPDSSPDIPKPKKLKVTSFCANTGSNPCDYSAPAPDGWDWNFAPKSVQGGAYVTPLQICLPPPCAEPTHFLYFGYDGARDADAGRPFSYVRVTKVDADALNLVSETEIWNPDFAFATPALVWRSGSTKDEIAISLAFGGGGYFGDNAVGFVGDGVYYATTGSNATQIYRYGDYFSVRNSIAPGNANGKGLGYSTLGYAVTQGAPGKDCNTIGCNITLQYVLFGRTDELFPVPPPPPPN